MDKTFSGTRMQSMQVPVKASVSMCVNSKSVLNEIDESDSQSQKHDEQRI
jgi:hypothetical protein